MNKAELIARFRQFAIDVAMLINDLPKNTINSTYCGQLIRSSSSSGANYRASQRAKSSADFINKLKIVEEETDESIFFLDLLCFFNSPFHARIEKLMKEANKLLSITVASIITARNNNKK
jgi:four helix bundle protein